MAMITVPKTRRGVNGFIEKAHDALVEERDLEFRMDTPFAHTAAVRILAEIDPPIPLTTTPGVSTIEVDKTLIAYFGGRYTLERIEIRAFGRRYLSGDIDKFKKDLERAARSGRRMVFAGDHTVVARIYQSGLIRRHITNVLIKEIEKGGLPSWRKPWASQERPRSGRPGERPYGAFNAFRLNSAALERGYTDPRWVTCEYAQEMRRPVRRAEVGSGVSIVSVYPNPVAVYNWEQLEGARNPSSVGLATLPKAESIIEDYAKRERRLGLRFRSPARQNEMDRAFYFAFDDSIVMPPKHLFSDVSRYYMTAFHEIAHSTGHSKRRDRHDGDSKWERFGTKRYGHEELVAEIAACLIASDTELARDFHRSYHLGHGGGSAVRESSAAYLLSWLKGASSSALYTASQEADNAYKYALDVDGFREASRDRARKRERKRKAKARAGKKR